MGSKKSLGLPRGRRLSANYVSFLQKSCPGDKGIHLTQLSVDRPHIHWPLTWTSPVIGRAGGAPGSAPGFPLTFLFILPRTIPLPKLSSIGGMSLKYDTIVCPAMPCYGVVLPELHRLGLLRHRLQRSALGKDNRQGFARRSVLAP